MLRHKKVNPTSLPKDLEAELLRLREDFWPFLRRLDGGDYSELVGLTGLELSLSKVLAREARRPMDQRRVRLTELAIAIERFFPELKPWRDMRLREAERAALAKAIAGSRARSLAS